MPTAEHLQAAFSAMGWKGWTFDAAMADRTRRAIVSWRARQMQRQAAKARRTRVVPSSGSKSRTRHRALPALPPQHITDLKRAAAGDRDD